MTDTANAPERMHVNEGVAVKDGIVTKVKIQTNPVSSRGEECFGPLYVLAAHCDELVAAAYLDAAQVLEDEIDLARIALPQAVPVLRADIRAIKNRTPTKAMAALTARDERMKAEGASEAQAKIARLTEALDEKQDGGKDFWMNWAKKRLEINRAMFLRDAKMALAGDMRALRNRVELMEAEPVQLVLSAALQENANG